TSTSPAPGCGSGNSATCTSLSPGSKTARIRFSCHRYSGIGPGTLRLLDCLRCTQIHGQRRLQLVSLILPSCELAIRGIDRRTNWKLRILVLSVGAPVHP